MATRLSALTAIALLLSAGCATTDRSSNASQVAAATPAELRVEEQLRLAEDLWRSRGPSNYTLSIKYSTFVSALGCNVQSYQVKNDRAESINPSGCGPRKDKFGSVPALFKFSRELLAQRQGDATATFDPLYGYPKKFYVGRPDISDAYFSFEIVAFTPQGSASGP